jgi:hypothetical protein
LERTHVNGANPNEPWAKGKQYPAGNHPGQ